MGYRLGYPEWWEERQKARATQAREKFVAGVNGDGAPRQIEVGNHGEMAGIGTRMRQEGPTGGGNTRGTENLAEQTETRGGAATGGRGFGFTRNPNVFSELYLVPHTSEYLVKRPLAFKKRPPIYWNMFLTPNVLKHQIYTPIHLVMCKKPL